LNGSSVITDARLYWLRCHKARQGTAYRAQSSSNGRFDVVAASAKTRSTNRQCTKGKGRGQPPKAGRACWRLPLELAEELPTLSALHIVHTCCCRTFAGHTVAQLHILQLSVNLYTTDFIALNGQSSSSRICIKKSYAIHLRQYCISSTSYD